MIYMRGKVDIDITPANWPPRDLSMCVVWPAVLQPLGAEDLDPEIRELFGLFCEIRLDLKQITATIILPAHLTDAEIEERRKRLVALLTGEAGGMSEILEEDFLREIQREEGRLVCDVARLDSRLSGTPAEA